MRVLIVRIFMALISGVLLMGGCSRHQNPPEPPAQQPGEAATNALGVLQKLVNGQNYKSLGFESLDEVKQAQLGRPFQIYNISFDKLMNYKAGQDTSSLLTESPETIYPVMVGGNVRSGVTIVHTEQGYEPASFGNADLVKRLSEQRQAGSEFVVRIPVFHMYFAGRHVGTRLVLTPIMSDRRLKLEAGQAAPAEVVMEQLRPYVNAYGD